MFHDMANAATALRNFWLWHQFLKSPVAKSEALVPLTPHCDWIIEALLHGNRDLEDVQLDYVKNIQNLSNQIKEGTIPSLKQLAIAFPSGLDSPQAKYILSRYTYYLHQAGTLGQMRSEQLNLWLQLYERENMLRHLEHTCAKYPSGSKEAKELRVCIAYLRTAMQQMHLVLMPLLEKDPSRGGTINLTAINHLGSWFAKANQKLLCWFKQRRPKKNRRTLRMILQAELKRSVCGL